MCFIFQNVIINQILFNTFGGVYIRGSLLIGFILYLFVGWPMIAWVGGGGGGAYKRQFAALLNSLPTLGCVGKMLGLGRGR